MNKSMNPQDSQRELIAEILRTGHHGIAETKVINAIEAYVTTRVKEAERNNGSQLSKILFEAREYAQMLSDITNINNPHDRINQFVIEIDNFRVSKGWDKHGFGGEDK